jgi:bacillithiol system protein YtxJ
MVFRARARFGGSQHLWHMRESYSTEKHIGGFENMLNIERIKTQDALEDTLDLSMERLVFLFKHSTACPVSARAYGEYQDFAASLKEDTPLRCGLILVIEDRSLSDLLSLKLGVKHESPQLLLVSERKAIWHASHYRLTKDSMERILKSNLRKCTGALVRAD